MIVWGAQNRAPQSLRLREDVVARLSNDTAVQARTSVVSSWPRAGSRPGDSLRGTAIDGAVHLNANGAPIADYALRRLFDYFISRIGERNERQIRGDLKSHLEAKLAPAAVVQVLVWFDAYVTLERSSAALATQGGDMRAAVMRLRALRRERMGEEIAEAWWGDEDRYLDYTLAREDLLADRSLDAAQRWRKLAELDRTLDPARLTLRTEDEKAERSFLQSEDYAQRGVSATQRFAEREREYGAEAARRLAELDTQRSQWDNRVNEYAAQRGRILGNPSLTQVQRDQQLNQLLARAFNETERKRVDVLVRNNLLAQP